MFRQALIIGGATLMCAVPIAAQERGTMEFGAFGSAASFDKALTLTSAFGGGGRVGMFLDPRWSIEFEDAEMRASRPNGLQDVNVGILSGRIVNTPLKVGRLSVLLGAGAGVSTETNFLHSYGVDVLTGVKFNLSDKVALRVDGVWDWLANEDWKSYRSVRAGLTLYRHPNRRVETVAGPTVMRPSADSVSAAETRRLRASDAALRALRDSINNAPRAVEPAAAATMEADIRFGFDESVLTDSAKRVLNEKVSVFRANPEMVIVIVGHSDQIGTDSYNMSLGSRRAAAAKAYLVSQGIAENRVIIETRGETQPTTSSPGVAGQAPNRRAIFRLLVAPDDAQ